MKTVTQRLTATGNGQWIPLNAIGVPFEVSLFVNPGTGVTLAAKVQLTGDRPSDTTRNITATRAATTATVTDPAHGLVTGDSILVFGAGAPFDTVGVGSGAADVTVVDANTYTYTVLNSGLTTANPGARVTSLRVFDHATLNAVTARTNGNIAFPVYGARLQVATLSGGAASVDFVVRQGLSA